MMSSRIERSEVYCFGPSPFDESDARIRQLQLSVAEEIDSGRRFDTLKRVAVYLGLALICTLFWGGVLWLATR